MRRNLVHIGAILSVGLTACGVADEGVKPGHRLQSSATVPALHSATVGTPVPLPFDVKFSNRWNDSNNGSPFEPCVAYSAGELEAFGVDASAVEDAAVVGGQGVRGCSWPTPGTFSLSQLVTNSVSLDVYRAGTKEYEWRSDFDVSGRMVGLFSLGHTSGKSCSTYVQSLSAGVVTKIVTSTSDEGQKIDPCKLVEDFTRAYIDKIPN